MLMWKIVTIPKLMWQALTRVNKNQKFQFYGIYRFGIFGNCGCLMILEVLYYSIWKFGFAYCLLGWWENIGKKCIFYLFIQFMYFGDLVYFLKGFLNYIIYWSTIIEMKWYDLIGSTSTQDWFLKKKKKKTSTQDLLMWYLRSTSRYIF